MPEERHLHIVSFTIPYPANYGGVIDVYYKLVALHKAGIKIHLHCFQYDREQAPELNEICETVNYYPRRTGISSFFSTKPYIVASRKSKKLLENLLQDDYPILFEGLHSCYYLNHPKLAGRTRVYRESNIEHHYYYHLFKAERNPFAKIYFLFAGTKLRFYQSILKHATKMLVVSEADYAYLSKKFKHNKVVYLPSFHGNEEVKTKTGTGTYALYHGNLSVAENYKAAEYLIKKVFNDLDIPFKIAGMKPPEKLKKIVDKYDNISLIANPSQERMDELVSNAHVHVMVTFQPTGLKLKLLNTLYNGRFVLVNPEMVAGVELHNLCHIADTSAKLKASLIYLFSQRFEQYTLVERQHLLKTQFSDKTNAKRLIEAVFG